MQHNIFIICLTVLTLSGCSKKYITYEAIEKTSFVYPGDHNPITPKMVIGKRQLQSSCHDQWLFNRNAMKLAEEDVRMLVQYMCPDAKHLRDITVTEKWWTILFYSRACVEIEAACPHYSN
jgi:hypothetical protein